MEHEYNYLHQNHFRTICIPGDTSDSGLHQIVSPFRPGTVASYKRLPPDCYFKELDGPDVPRTAAGDGVGIVHRLTTEDGSVLILLDVGEPVSNNNFPGSVWHRIWFFPHELTILTKAECRQVVHRLMPSDAVQHKAAPTGHRAEAIFKEGEPPPDMIKKIVRYTSVYKVLGWGGGNFSTKDADKQLSEAEEKVWDAKQKEIFASMSQPLPKNKWFDYFISYRWKMGRAFTTLSLMAHLNHWKAAVFTFVSTLVIQVAAGLVEHYCGVAILPYKVISNRWYQNVKGTEHYGGIGHPWVPWIFSIWFRSFAMGLGVFCFSQLTSRSRVFLDKLCIHQSDEDLNVSSLKHFPYLLKRCRGLICVIDAVLSECCSLFLFLASGCEIIIV